MSNSAVYSSSTPKQVCRLAPWLISCQLQGFTYALCVIRWWLEAGSSTQTVCFSHPGACGPEGGLQQSHGGDRLTNAQVSRIFCDWTDLSITHYALTCFYPMFYFRFKIYGELPLLSLRISDDKVRGVLALLSSIPLPESRPSPQTRAPQVTPKVIKSMFMGVSS